MKKVNLRSKVFALCVLLFVCLLPMSAFAASDPLKSTKITVSKVRSILKQYCPDGYYIIRNDGDADANLTRWWSQGDTLEEGIDAAVHEQTHAYSFYKMDYNWKTGLWSENIYTGNGKKVKVWMTKTFPTSKAVSSYPQKYRTFRYSTYVSEGSMPDSNRKGVYGLLNEFTAYGMVLDTSVRLYACKAKYAKHASDYDNLKVNALNDKNAYAEFLCWTLSYLQYADKNQKSIYKGIVKNKSYLNAFKAVNRKWQSNLRKFSILEKRVDNMRKRESGGGSWGGLTVDDDYSVLLPLINSGKYAKYRKLLGVGILK